MFTIFCRLHFQDIRQLTQIVLTLSEFQLLCNATEAEILSAKQPLSVFFSSCGKLHEQASDQTKRLIADRLQSALNGFEIWIPISESPPAIFKIHMVIALIIFSCSPIVYVRVSRILSINDNLMHLMRIYERFFFEFFSVKADMFLLCDNESLHFTIAIADGKAPEARFNSSCSSRMAIDSGRH